MILDLRILNELEQGTGLQVLRKRRKKGIV
jgi:hypothetical protein